MSYERKVKVILHGSLKKLYDKPIELVGYSASEIISGLCRLSDVFKKKPGQERLLIKVLGFNSKESLFEPLPHDISELHMYPEMAGGKSGGFVKIAIAAVLIAVAFMFPPADAGITLFGASGILFSVGVSLALGGLLEILSPTPKADSFGNSAADPEASKYLGANQNTVKIGTRIPLLYGETIAYGHYLSFDVGAMDVAA